MISRLMLLAALVAPVAAAQPASHPFFPLQEGNSWVYDVYGSGTAGSQRIVTIVGWEGEGEAAYWRAAVTLQAYGSPSVLEGECSYRVLESNDSAYLQIATLSGSGCPTIQLAAPGIPLPASGAAETVWISGEPTQVTVGTRTAMPPWDAPGTNRFQMIEGVGMLEHLWDGFAGPSRVQRLAYAVIAGEAIGVPPDVFHETFDPMLHVPLAVGNEWVYEARRFEPGVDVTTLRHLLITGYNSSTGRYEAQVTDYHDGSASGPHGCTLWIDAMSRLAASGHDSCVLGANPLPGRWSHYMTAAAEIGPLEITGTEHDLMSLAFENVIGGNPWENRESESYRSAYGVGMLSYEHRMYYASAGVTFGRTLHLQYARVAGVGYGVNPLGTGSEPAPTAMDIAVFPNPATHVASVSLTVPDASEVTVEVFDALGRRVFRHLAAGAAPGTEVDIMIDTARLAAGAYVVRASTPGGSVGVARLAVVR